MEMDFVARLRQGGDGAGERHFVTKIGGIVSTTSAVTAVSHEGPVMHYSHQNTQLRYEARLADISRLHAEDGLVGRLVRSLRRPRAAR